MDPLKNLLRIIEEVAAGHYTNEIMALTGPDVPEPIRTVAEAMGLMMVRVEAREYRLEMLVQELEALNGRIKQNAIGTVSALARALEVRDPYTEGHAMRVADLAEKVARELGLEEEAVGLVRLGGQLHDIGKIGFPDALFQPHGGKNPPELKRAIIQHPAIGGEVLKDLDFLGSALDDIRCHHERLDGLGYPRGLKAGEIPQGARIIAVADAYDAMTTERPYQKAKSPEEALAVLRSRAGTHWDPACIEALARVLTGREIAEA